MTAEAPERPPTPAASDESGGQHTYNPAEAELRHYSPEQVYDLALLPIKPSTLKRKAQLRQIPHSRAGERITFLLRHIREIQAMTDAPVMNRPHHA